METIPLSECTKIGYLQKPHGVAGAFVLLFEELYEDAVGSADIFFIKIDGLLVPFFISDDGANLITSNRAHIKFRWIDSAEKAREFCGNEVYLKTSEINSGNTEADYSLLVGFSVIDSLKREIGKISEVNDYNGNVVLTVDYFGREVLVPFHPDIVGFYNEGQKIIQIYIPEGLLNIDEF